MGCGRSFEVIYEVGSTRKFDVHVHCPLSRIGLVPLGKSSRVPRHPITLVFDLLYFQNVHHMLTYSLRKKQTGPTVIPLLFSLFYVNRKLLQK